MARQINFNAYLIKIYGAYIRTNISSLVDINGVASGVIGLVGLSEKGEVGVPTRVFSYVDLVNKFGDGPLVRHGLAMFVGGASEIVVVRIGNPKSASLSATKIDPGATGSKSYTISALERGTFGNNVSFAVFDEDLRGNDSKTSVGVKRFDDNRYRVVVRYADRFGNDLREEFLFPRYIPSPRMTKGVLNPDGSVTSKEYGRFFNQNTDRYFLLRDRRTGDLREIPEVWTYGSEISDPTNVSAISTVEDFVQVIEDLKSNNEDLLTFPTNLENTSERSPYPIAVIAHVVNNGGFGYPASQFVNLDDISPTLEDLIPDLSNAHTPGEIPLEYNLAEVLIPHPPVALAGGTNGDDGTSYYVNKLGNVIYDYSPTLGSSEDDDALEVVAAEARQQWTQGLALLEEEDVNFVQLGYLFNPRAHNRKGTTWKERYGFFKSVMPLLTQHVSTQSNTPNRRFRTSVVGTPWYKSPDTKNKQSDVNFMDEIKELSGIVNSDRFQVFVGGFKSRAFSTNVESYGAEMLASFAVGVHASLEPQDSITFRQIAGIFTDGLEFYWGTEAKNEIYSRAYNSIFRRKNSTGGIEFIAANNLTSWTGASNRGMSHYITRRITDYMNSFVYKNLEENFIGRQSKGAETASQINTFVTYLLERLVAEGKLVAYANLVVRALAADPTVYEIFYDFQPVSEINFILTTNTLSYQLA